MNRLGRYQQGIGMIEVMITLVVIAFGVLAHVGLQRYTFHTATLASQRTAATELARDKLEDLRGFCELAAAGSADCDAAYDDITDNAGGTISHNGSLVSCRDDNCVTIAGDSYGCTGGSLQEGNTTYSRCWKVAADTGIPNLKQVTVIIGWEDIDGHRQTFGLSSFIAGIDPAAASRIYQ